MKDSAMLKQIEHCFCQYLKNNIPDIRLIPLDYVTYEVLLNISSGIMLYRSGRLKVREGGIISAQFSPSHFNVTNSG